jgi:hypothetical protein
MSGGAVARPRGVSALAIFFGVGALISFASGVSLLFPGSPLEPMWKLNPRAREAFDRMDPGGVLLLAAVCVACASAALGLWSGRLWGYRLAVVLLTVNLLGDLANVLLGVEPRALVGVPIVAALLFFLASARVRSYFRSGA